jgi:hypothetical protein
LEAPKGPDTYGFRGFRPKTVGQKLPPYGRRLLALRRAGRIPDTQQIVIAVGDWTLVNKNREDAVVVPYGEPVADFDFRFCAGLPVLMVVNEHDIGVADEVAQKVIAAGSRGCICLIRPAFVGKTGLKVYQSHFGR